MLCLFYKTIADFGLQHLNKDGRLYFEINEIMGNKVKELLEQKSYSNIEVKKDMQGKDRMVRVNSYFTIATTFAPARLCALHYAKHFTIQRSCICIYNNGRRIYKSSLLHNFCFKNSIDHVYIDQLLTEV
jgi:hypothetical protein